MDQGPEQALVIALVQADGGLIQDVHHANQSGANLARQTDTLGLAAGERFRRAGERQVVEADVDEELQAIANLFQHFFGDFRPLAGELQIVKEVHRVADAHIGNGRQRGVFHKHVARLTAQTRTVAAGARAIADELRQLFAHRAGFRLFVAALHVMQHAFERMAAHRGVAAVVHVFEFNILFTGTVQDHFLHAGAEGAPRRFNVKLIVLRQRLQHLEVVEVTPIPAADGAARQRQLRILHHAIGVEILLHAETVAGRAGTRRVVEGEQARLQLAHAVAADRAGEVGGKQQLFRFLIIHIGHDGGTAGELQRGFKRLGQTLRQIVADLEAVDDHLDGVFLLQLQLRRIREIADFAVDPCADIALAGEVFQGFGVLAFTLFNNGRQQHQTQAFRLGEDVIDHLADGLRRQRHVVVRTARLADAGVQQTQVVVNFGNRTHRRAGVVRG
ncbi:hypothetical protein SB00610_03288 [Klebsiella quasipneumoniae subsp. similipneumoniae]|nr:hypothetical protein SB00610_03288 [Klebsiella quasipneumoniae subsp. similipneumoniae]